MLLRLTKYLMKKNNLPTEKIVDRIVEKEVIRYIAKDETLNGNICIKGNLNVTGNLTVLGELSVYNNNDLK